MTITLSNKPKHDLALGIGLLCGEPFIGFVMGSKITGVLDSAIDKIFPPQVVGGGNSLTSRCQMVCPISGTITYASGITSEWTSADIEAAGIHVVNNTPNFGSIPDGQVCIWRL